MGTDDSRLISAARELVGAEVLVVDSDPAVYRGMMQLLAPVGLHVTPVSDHEKALELVVTKFFGVAIIDLDTPAANAGVELVRQIRERSPITLVLVLSPRKSFEGAIAAFRAGAHDVIMKAPDQVEYLKARIVDAAGDAATRHGTGTLLNAIRDALEEFLRKLMEAERNRMDAEDKLEGRSPDRATDGEEIRILVVDSDDRLYRALTNLRQPGFQYALAQTAGEALDDVTNSEYHLALVGPNLPDLPPTMVIKALKAQAPSLIVIAYVPNGKLEVVETTRTIPIADKFTAATQLTDRLGELAEAHRVKGRERRYLQAFRERHYDFLRKLAELRKRIDKAIEDDKDTFSFPGAKA